MTETAKKLTPLWIALPAGYRPSQLDEGLAERELYERVAQAKRAESLGVLAGGIAHDMNNVLSAIMSIASAVLIDLRRQQEISEEDLESIVEAQRAFFEKGAGHLHGEAPPRYSAITLGRPPSRIFRSGRKTSR